MRRRSRGYVIVVAVAPAVAPLMKEVAELGRAYADGRDSSKCDMYAYDENWTLP